VRPGIAAVEGEGGEGGGGGVGGVGVGFEHLERSPFERRPGSFPGPRRWIAIAQERRPGLSLLALRLTKRRPSVSFSEGQAIPVAAASVNSRTKIMPAENGGLRGEMIAQCRTNGAKI
jgi:hypothetical protein